MKKCYCVLAGLMLLFSTVIPSNIYSQGCNPGPDSLTLVFPVDHNFTHLTYMSPDTITIPNHKPAYALFVHGFTQNQHLDLVLCYWFAKELAENGAYVHHAWWNNLCGPHLSRPLHYEYSHPGTHGYGVDAIWDPNDPKALPPEDFQFQADAKIFLDTVRAYNPNAKIILVGHSMGGGAVTRLADTTDIVIDILAPIDPVENRSHPAGRIPWLPYSAAIGNFLPRDASFTRWRLAHPGFKGYKTNRCVRWIIWPVWCAECGPEQADWLPYQWFTDSRDPLVCPGPIIHQPDQRVLEDNVINLYHRWQQEYVFPFDYYLPAEFVHSVLPSAISVQENTNTQSAGWNPIVSDWGYGTDGHGEIVGYWGELTFDTDPVPYGVRMRQWPYGQHPDSVAKRRDLLMAMDTASSDWIHRPLYPQLCHVSEDLRYIFLAGNRWPVVEAGEDQVHNCAGPGGVQVNLGGSISDFDGPLDLVYYGWEWSSGSVVGHEVTINLPVGEHCITKYAIDRVKHKAVDRLTVTVLSECIDTTDYWIVAQCELPMLGDWYVAEGTIVHAFDPDGIMCGVDTVGPDGALGPMGIYGDNPNTPETDEGAEPGDVLTFRMNDKLVLTEPPAEWTQHGDTVEVCQFIESGCQTIPLHYGWNLISWRVAYSGDITEFLGDAAENVDVVLGFDGTGQVYDPSLPEFSSLQQVDYHHGYWLRMNTPDTLEICAPRIDSSDYIPIHPGWNLVAYWPEEQRPVLLGLASLIPNVQVAYTYAGGMYHWMANDPFHSNLILMGQNYGYWLWSNAGDALTYFSIWPGTEEKEMPAQTMAESDPVSSRWMSVYGANLDFAGEAVPDGALIEVTTDDGIVCGSGVYRGGILKLTPVYGKDEHSPELPVEGDPLVVLVDGREVSHELTFEGHGARVALCGHTSGAVPGLFRAVKNYPNPFNNSTRVSFEMTRSAYVRLDIYNLTGQKVARLVEGQLDAGEHSITWEAAGVASGVYFYRLEAEGTATTAKMMLIK